MDLAKIKSLIDAMAASDLTEMEFSEDGWTLRLRRGAGARETAPAPVDAPAATEDGARILSPLFGVVYLRPSPEAPDFVRVGDEVAAGALLCVVEAMKVFNEVRAPRAGVIAAVCVASGDEVEVGRELVRLA